MSCPQGLHPRIVAEGLDKAKDKALSVSPWDERLVTREAGSLL